MQSLPNINVNFNLVSIIDILLVALVLYKLILLIKGTRAVQLLKGLAVLLVATTVSNWLGFYTINWLLERTMTVVTVALPIVFQPELRRALEQLGRGKFFAKSSFMTLDEEEAHHLINELSDAIQVLVRQRLGALIVIERLTGVSEYIETGTKIDATVSSQLLTNIFIPNTPLHDGAVIIQGDRIAAAACFLPLSDNQNISKSLGTRHRAALGLSELSDAAVLVVSEETGVVSMASEGKLTRYLDEKTLRELLAELLLPKGQPTSIFNWRSGADV